MGRQIYLTDEQIDYLKSLLEAQDPHDDDNPDTAHYETARIAIGKKLDR